MIQLSGRRALLVTVALLCILGNPRPSYAYLDPGSASYTLQMLIALALSTAFVIKAYWAKLKRFVTGVAPSSERQEDKLPESGSGDTP